MAPPPPSAAEVDDFSLKLDALLSALNSHPLKTSTPATTAPAIYFTWDFVQRSKSMLSDINVDALVNNNDQDFNKAYWDCVGRGFLINLMIRDETGKADLMLEGPRVDFGAQVKACARALGSSNEP